MLEPPVEFLSCSWPRPIEHRADLWISDPDWNAPQMPYRPQPLWQIIEGEPCWTFNWREHFRAGLKTWDPSTTGSMSGFHILFRLRVTTTGQLVFWDDDGCIIRRNGELIHVDRSAHRLTRHTLDVQVGDVLEVAQWQLVGDWIWAARVMPQEPAEAPLQTLRPHLNHVLQRLQRPVGPPLKMYTHGAHPLRTIVGIYGLILRGYVPSRVLLYGENQWNNTTRSLFSALLPFAEVIPQPEVDRQLRSLGGPRLVDLARDHWYVMKAFVAVLCPPQEFCLLDDDIFILAPLDDALNAFKHHDLVYAPDFDHGAAYLAAWGWMHGQPGPLLTGRFNAGLYWMRHQHDLRRLAACALKVRPHTSFIWEQGFIANLFPNGNTLALSSARYLFPLFDGLPGGILGYDYANNPCGFASVHYGGLLEKPSDAVTLMLLSQLLGTPPGSATPPALQVHRPVPSASKAEAAPAPASASPTEVEVAKSPAPPLAPIGQLEPDIRAEVLVSCIMPTRNRPELVLRALEYFRRQDYPARELIIIDDGGDMSQQLPSDPALRYVHLPAPLSIGAKRNLACTLARGRFIAHWDDDDWYAPERLRAQVEPLLRDEADLTGLITDLIFDLPRWEFWRLTPALHRRMFRGDVHGGTLVYKRTLWEHSIRYPEWNLGEDEGFLREALRRGARLARLPNGGRFIYLRHTLNSWSFVCGQHLDPGGWSSAEEAPFSVEDRAFYAARSRTQAVQHALAKAYAPRPVPSSTSRQSAPRPRVLQAPPARASAPQPRDDSSVVVSCMMPTANRRPFVPLAIEHFLHQDYPHKELIVIDDGEDPVADLIPSDVRIRYMRLKERHPLGYKRNLACEEARGTLIAHWDDDDWMAPWRLSYQVAQMLETQADICGLDRLLFFDPLKSQGWQFIYGEAKPPWVAGGTLCYTRQFWQRNHFAEINIGEDTRFVWKHIPKKLVVLEDNTFYVARIHPGNTSPKRIHTQRWHPFPVQEILMIMQQVGHERLSSPASKPYNMSIDHVTTALQAQPDPTVL